MNDASHVREVFEKAVYSETGLSGEEFEDCSFVDCNFSAGDLSRSRFTDCQFVGCNLSMAKVGQTELRNATFLNCKIVGVDFSACLSLLFSVSFEKCCLDYCGFVKSKLKKTRFLECAIREADFTEADLAQATFDDCDLANTLFSRTNLRQADFLTARNYSINPELNMIRKAKFSLAGAAGLLSHYDIVVK